MERSDWILGGEVLDKKRDRGSEGSLVESILDLTFYDDNKLLTQAFYMIHRLFSATSSLCEYAKQAQLLVVPSSVQLVEKLDADLPIIRRLAGGTIEPSEALYVLVLLVALCSYNYKDYCMFQTLFGHTEAAWSIVLP